MRAVTIGFHTIITVIRIGINRVEYIRTAASAVLMSCHALGI